jgi:hypothetical protein
MKKSRHLYLHSETNAGKVVALESLHVEYVAYVRICVQAMLDNQRLNLKRSEKQAFFPKAENLTSQIQKNARDHAIQIVSAWAKATYERALKTRLTRAHRFGQISQDERHALCTVGKHLISEPWKHVTQEAIDAYRALLLDPEISGNPPRVSDCIPMRMSENTCTLTDADEAVVAPMWLKISTLVSRKVIWLPLCGNPYVESASDVSKGIHARKDKRGRWRFEVVERKEWVVPEPQPEAPRIGVDVGLNVIAATSDGRTFGADLKPKFDRLYERVKNLRANRQRQGLKENSKRLDRLEDKLTGMVKTITGEVANKLVRSALKGTVFVIEDLELRGCRGQKRFAYRALAHNLETKAPTLKVNPAYTSQTCPSCGYVSRRNRSGINFVCRSCGRRSHADVVGGINLLRRSQDEQVGLDDHHRNVRELLRARYRACRAGDSAAGLAKQPAPEPSGRRLTTGASPPRRGRHGLKSGTQVYPSS